MGLDMYLTARKSFWEFEKEKTDQREKIGAVIGIDTKKHLPCNVSYEAVYWRKANAIHAWFVEHVQDGEDECNEHYASRDDMEELLAVCKKVKGNNSLAGALLPPKSGFFFGGTDVDEYYFTDIDNTISKVSDALKTFNDGWEFYYRSSW